MKQFIPKETMTCKCGKPFKPYYRNGILVSPDCPNCRYRKAINKAVERRSTSTGARYSKKVCKAINPKKPIDKKLDIVWSKLVKLKAGNKCAVCGKTKPLNSHHIYSRGNMALRWSIDNGICLCVGHHIGFKFSAHKTSTEFTKWLIAKFGQDFIDKLELYAHTQVKYTEFEKEIILKNLQQEIKRLNKIIS